MSDDYGDYGDDDYDDNGEGGIFGDDRDAYERTNIMETVDLKNPKQRFLHFITENASIYPDISEDDLEKIKTVVKQFRDIEYENYNVDGILIGFIIYKQKFNTKKINELHSKYDTTAYKFDMIRYARLWDYHLKISK